MPCKRKESVEGAGSGCTSPPAPFLPRHAPRSPSPRSPSSAHSSSGFVWLKDRRPQVAIAAALRHISNPPPSPSHSGSDTRAHCGMSTLQGEEGQRGEERHQSWPENTFKDASCLEKVRAYQQVWLQCRIVTIKTFYRKIHQIHSTKIKTASPFSIMFDNKLLNQSNQPTH